MKLPYIGGEGGPHHLNRKNQLCVLNSFFEDPLVCDGGQEGAMDVSSNPNFEAIWCNSPHVRC